MRELWGSPDIWHIKRSYVEIAAKLSVDEETVRNRVRHLREIGFLLGYRLVPNPDLLGRSIATVNIEFKDRDTKQATVPQLAKIEGVVSIIPTYEKSALVILAALPDQDFSKLLEGLEVDARIDGLPSLNVRPTSFRMTRLDWEIVALLLRDAESRLDEVAKSLRVSTRSVRRRLNMMMRETAIFTMPMVDLRKNEGISYQLRVQSEPVKKSEVENAIIARVGDVVFRATDSQNGSIFGFNGTNVAEGNDLLEWVQQLPGVRSASMTISERVIHVFDWIQDQVRKQVEAKLIPVTKGAT